MNPASKYCGECGVSLEPNARFCGECGAAVDNIPDKRGEQPGPGVSEYSPGVEKKKNPVTASPYGSKKQIITAFIMLAMVAVAWGAAVFIADQDNVETGAWALLAFQPVLAAYVYRCVRKYRHYLSALFGIGAILFSLSAIFLILD